MEKIKSKKSYNIDFEDLFDDTELIYKKCKKKKKKKKKSKKHKSSNKSFKESKKLNKDLEITKDFFSLDDNEVNITKKRYIKSYSKSFLGKMAESVNVDAKVRVNITDEVINNIILVAAGFIGKLFIKK